MRVAIDLRLNSYRLGGIPQYSSQLLAALRTVAPDVALTPIVHRKPMLGAPLPGTAHIHRVWTPPHHRLEQLSLPLELVNLRADVIHFPDFIPLFRLRTPAVITVHDLAFVRYPEILDAAAARYYGQIQRAIRHAAAIIAVSESTRADLVTLLGADPARIAVVPEAAAPQLRPLTLPADDARTINGHALAADTFALFVGTVEPRKNLRTLLQALDLLREREAAPPRLVVAGARGWLDSDVFRLVEERGLQQLVCFLGPVTDPELQWLYGACRVYLHPELYSGFGLPVLEAMQAGAPVIVADTSSLPEVAGDAALLLPPEDAAAWADSWARLWSDASLRAELRSRGLAQAARFSWTAAAEATLAVYRSVVGRRRS